MKRKSTLSIVLILALISTMCMSFFSVKAVAVAGSIGDTIYVKSDSAVNCYAWKGSGGAVKENNAWPGVAMTQTEPGVYSYTLTDAYEKVIFNGGFGQTKDLDYPGNGMIFDRSSGKWEPYGAQENPPMISFNKKDGSTFKTDTVDVTITATNADSASYKVNGGSAVSFTGSTTVTVGAGIDVDSTVTISVTATNQYGTKDSSITLTKKQPSQGGGGSIEGALGGKYATNPDSKVGKRGTIKIDGDISDWSEDMIIAQGAAWDVANHWKGGHENCVLDTYALYASWDDQNLYVGWQMVNTTDTWARSGDGPLSDGGRVLDVPLILALSVDESSTSMSNKNTSGGPIWGQKMGLEFTKHVDRLFYMSGKPGLGKPSMFKAVDDAGNTDYTSGCVGYAEGGIEYDMATNCLSSSIIGLNYSENPEDVFNEDADWVDYKTFKGSQGVHNTKFDSFYEMKIPLALLEIDASYIESNGIGAMLVATRGESALDCIPYDPSMIDNVTGGYSADPSTSLEKEDVDNITVPLARIGKIGSGQITPTTPKPTPTTPSPTPSTPGSTTPTPSKPTTVSVSYNLDGVMSSNDATTATGSYDTILIPTGEDEISTAYAMCGTDRIEATNNGDGTFSIHIDNIKGNITIVAEAKSSSSFLLGDVDGSGVVDVRDAALIQKHCVGLQTVDLKTGDINGDGKITIQDVTYLQKKIAGLVD